MRRETALAGFTAGLCACLAALIVARGVWQDPAGASSYAALAEAFLNGRLHLERCPEVDCAPFDGRIYLPFPPLPAAILAPIVAFVGADAFRGGVFIALTFSAISLWLWRRIFAALETPEPAARWLLAAIAFASPLYFVTLMGNGLWFFAQVCGFLFMTLAIAAVVLWRSLALAGLFVALAMLCRQMAIFYPLFLLALAVGLDERRNERLLAPSRETIRGTMLAAIPVLAAIALMLAYNHARFGNMLDSGYGHISNPALDNIVTRRIADIGLFSAEYVLFNLLHLFTQGLHVSFAPPHHTQIAGVDMAGSAILIASPWLGLLFFTRMDRVALAGFAVIAILAGTMLFYHSNGFEQVNTQRYALDWLPIAVVLLARSARPQAFAALPLLVCWGAALNAVAMAVRFLPG